MLSQCGGAGAAEHRQHRGERVFGLPGGLPRVQQRDHAALPAQLPLRVHPALAAPAGHGCHLPALQAHCLRAILTGAQHPTCQAQRSSCLFWVVLTGVNQGTAWLAQRSRCGRIYRESDLSSLSRTFVKDSELLGGSVRLSGCSLVCAGSTPCRTNGAGFKLHQALVKTVECPPHV